MKTIPAGMFKTNCLTIMDEVKAKRETVVITKHGKPVAKLVRSIPVWMKFLDSSVAEV